MTVSSKSQRRPGRKVAALVLAGMLPLLAACSDEPSENEMKGLVENHTRDVLQRQGQGGFAGFVNFRKQGCVVPKLRNVSDRTKGGENTLFDCYYAATFGETAARPGVTVNGKGRFTSTEKGFHYQDLGAQPR